MLHIYQIRSHSITHNKLFYLDCSVSDFPVWTLTLGKRHLWEGGFQCSKLSNGMQNQTNNNKNLMFTNLKSPKYRSFETKDFIYVCTVFVCLFVFHIVFTNLMNESSLSRRLYKTCVIANRFLSETLHAQSCLSIPGNDPCTWDRWGNPSAV